MKSARTAPAPGDFLTRDVEEVRRRGRGRSEFSQAFALLPESKAILRRREPPRTIAKTAAIILTTLKGQFPERRIHTQLDHDEDGVWVWWEPR